MYDAKAHSNIFAQLQEGQLKDTLTQLPGGAALNSARACQLILNSLGLSEKVAYFGAIGSDDNTAGSATPDHFGQVMSNLSNKAGVAAFYQVVPGIPSGSCAVCISAETKDRSMVTKLGASQRFDPAFMTAHWDTLHKVPLIHLSGFFATASLDWIQQLVKFCKSQGDKIVSFSLCAPFILSTFREHIIDWMKTVQIVVGDRLEWMQMRVEFPDQISDASTDADMLKSVTEHMMLQTSTKQKSTYRAKLAICTRGAESTLAVFQYGQNEFEVMTVEPLCIADENIVDTNGCGDAFLGGVWAGIIGQPLLKECLQGRRVYDAEVQHALKRAINLGHHVAAHALQRQGCDFTGYRLDESLR